MGGIGSGRFYHSGVKNTADDYRQIDVRRWARDGLLEPGHYFNWRWTLDGEETARIRVFTEPGVVRLVYRTRSYGEAWEDMDYKVRLLNSQCHFGGTRQWFSCPARGCGKRVAILYAGRVFACRHCYELAYPSQREQTYQRLLRRAETIRERLGWEWGQEYGPKPKGMHWQTFERLLAELDSFEERSNLGFIQYFSKRIADLDL